MHDNMMKNTYRPLTPAEITALEQNGCSAQEWSRVQVKDGFRPQALERVRFSGDIRLGRFEGSFLLKGGLERPSGICDATLHNVEVGDGCLIRSVRNHIANYRIGDGTLIDGIGLLAVDGPSSFGNGVRVSVLNETGGREVTIFDALSSHLAYMVALYRHRPAFCARVQELVDTYVEQIRSDKGTIGKGVRINDTGLILNARLGDGCRIEGASRLCNLSVNSRLDAPVVIGQGVVCEDAIISSDSHVTDGTMLTRCFVGQACRFGHGYSASDSLFFDNCQGENGEACAIFAGPFTVTHHKSTLLIAGIFSFMNAGSGSNQSNHLYKLGPIHQGTLERGAKTASDSYILWPARVGAFSLVMGRHSTHSDTTNLPFSYLIEKNDMSYLAPGVNLRSVGTIRDAKKWPSRDGRAPGGRLDYVNFNLLSPFTSQRMLKGLKTLENLKYASGELTDVYSFHSIKITNHALARGISLYGIALDKFFGNSLISRLQDPDGGFSLRSEADLQSRLKPDSPVGSGIWADISGLIAPQSELEALMEGIESGAIRTVADIDKCFRTMHEHYYSYEWTWVYEHMEQLYGIDPAKMTVRQAISLVERWKKAVIGLDQMLYEDAKKEFSLASKTGFGADGDKQQKEIDFEQVRGDFESSPFVNSVLEHIRVKSDLGDRVVTALNGIAGEV